ncbi:hypothetical protein MKZ38_005995 [Zalerion maritima]|uniref:Uncharacterized protein n=1 Tax=Zalerion maritima TaxID=339359 RepID=A0AAD5RK31_9PEZI|nr:hypothetical protein MKZ38_005995 [Zalerion maritima]
MSSKASGSGAGAEVDNYTNLHLAAAAFLHPPNPPHNKQCPCDTKTSPAQVLERNKHIRVYHNEPSPYDYNAGCYLVKETRYSTLGRWHAPSDDLVADDAATGSSVVAIGWRVEGAADGEGGTRIYYMDKNGFPQERANRTSFAPTVKEELETELPKPEELVPPTPGWKQTPISNVEPETGLDATAFPAISPLYTTKLAAVRSEDGMIHVLYQVRDYSI